MARIRLDVDDLSLRLTLKVMLETDGHVLTGQEHDVSIADNPKIALLNAKSAPALLLTTAANIPVAVKAMKQGVYGYIMLPLLPGEAPLMVQRALNTVPAENATPVPVSTLLKDAERLHIEAVMRQCKHNQAEAARLLGIARNTLWRKLQQYEGAA